MEGVDWNNWDQRLSLSCYLPLARACASRHAPRTNYGSLSVKRKRRGVGRGECQHIVDTGIDINGDQINATEFNSTASPLSSTSPVSAISSTRETYDNAYFYILFVMCFYAFLATTLFKCLGSDEEKKDPYEEFMSAGQSSTQKFNTGCMAEKFYFEEESSL
ncbi:hypothetical protein INR49_012940 [Caranx melampygus]|nr:hypothetical protein INR49_012940 [Caranx melampygus]